MTAIPPKREVSPRELRERFNTGDFEGRLKRGELVADVVVNRHPTAPKAAEPYCTRSQKIVYRDQRGVEVATVHQYLRTDGTIGAGGRPDPKRLMQDGYLYTAWWTPGTE